MLSHAQLSCIFHLTESRFVLLKVCRFMMTCGDDQNQKSKGKMQNRNRANMKLLKKTRGKIKYCS